MVKKLLRVFLFLLILGSFIIPVNSYAAPADAYWVGDTGNWSDANLHWATISGGVPNAANLPDANTNVHFDASSFSANNKFISINTANPPAHDFDFTGVDQTVSIDLGHGAGFLRIWGDAILSPLVSINTRLYFMGESHLTSNGAIFRPGASVIFDGGVAETLQLQDNFISLGELSCYSGTLDYNDKNVNCDMIYADDPGIVLMGNGTISVGAAVLWISTSAQIVCEGSTLVMTSPDGFISHEAVTDLVFHNLRINAPGYVAGDFINIEGAFSGYSIETLTIIPNDGVEFVVYDGITLNVNTFSATGTSTSPIIIGSDGDPTWTISVPSGNVVCDWLEIDNSTAIGGATFYAGSHSVNNGGNSGWIFGDPPGTSTLLNTYPFLVIFIIIWVCLVISVVWLLSSLGIPLVLVIVLGAILALLGPIGFQVILETLTRIL